MTEKDLFREIGMIDEKYVEEAMETKQKKILTPMFRKTLVTAACLCVCLGLYFGVKQLDIGGGGRSESATYPVSEDAAFDEMMQMESTSAVNGSSAGSWISDTMLGVSESASEPQEYVEENSADETTTEETDAFDGALERKDEWNTESNTDDNYAEATVSPNIEWGDAEVLDTVQNRESLDVFVAKVNEGEKVIAIMEQDTMEGDSVYYYIHYDGTGFFVRVSNTKDVSAIEDDAVWQYQFQHMTCLKDVSEGDSKVYLLFADHENVTWEQIQDGTMEYLVIVQ